MYNNVRPVCISNGCSDILIDSLFWKILPARDRSNLLSEPEIARKPSAKLLVVGANDEDSTFNLEYYCFNSKKWVSTFQRRIPDFCIGHNYTICNDDVFITGGMDAVTKQYSRNESVHSDFEISLKERAIHDFTCILGISVQS